MPYVENFKEIAGKGCEAWINEKHIVLGSPAFVCGKTGTPVNGSIVAYRIDHDIEGYFNVKNEYRYGIKRMLRLLGKKFRLSVISGDNDSEKTRLEQLAPKAKLLFNQTPEDKLHYTGMLQEKGRRDDGW